MNPNTLRITVAEVSSWTSMGGYRYENGWAFTIERKFGSEKVWCSVQHKQGFASERDARVAGKAAMELYRRTAE